jgi:hypothetical protein
VNIYEIKYESGCVYYVEGDSPEAATRRLEEQFMENCPARYATEGAFNVVSVKPFKTSKRDA